MCALSSRCVHAGKTTCIVHGMFEEFKAVRMNHAQSPTGVCL